MEYIITFITIFKSLNKYIIHSNCNFQLNNHHTYVTI